MAFSVKKAWQPNIMISGSLGGGAAVVIGKWETKCYYLQNSCSTHSMNVESCVSFIQTLRCVRQMAHSREILHVKPWRWQSTWLDSLPAPIRAGKKRQNAQLYFDPLLYPEYCQLDRTTFIPI
jgi:hypothetical protein